MNRLMRNPFQLCLSISLIFFISSCKDSAVKYQETATGLKYHFFKSNPASKSGSKGDIYILNTSLLKMSDSSFMSSELVFKRNTDFFKGGFPEALSLLKVGDSASFILSIDTFYNDYNRQIPNFLKGDSTFKINVGVVSIMTDFEHKLSMFNREVEDIAKFVDYKGWNTTTDSSSGIRYEIVKSNPEGAKIENGDEVEISYHSYTLKENPIDRSRDGDLWKLSVGDPTRISGLSRALNFMREGEAIRAILPFSEAYGEKGYGAFVPPFTSVVIEFEVHKHTKGEEVKIDLLN